MAYSRLPIHISLDECAQILQINPAHFNQGVVEGTIYGPCSANCVDVWCDESWQSLQGLSRYSVAVGIAQAEVEVASFLDKPLVATERKRLYQVGEPAAPRGIFEETRILVGEHLVDYRPYIPVEVATVTLNPDVEGDPGEVVLYDEDGDGFYETAYISIEYTEEVTNDNVVLYVADHFGEQGYQIRPVTISGGVWDEGAGLFNGLAKVWTWQLLKHSAFTTPVSANCSCAALDLSDTDFLYTSFAVGIMKPDMTVRRARFYYEEPEASCGDDTCPLCTEQFIDGDYYTIGNQVVVYPAEYDSDTETWVRMEENACYGCGRWPAYVEVSVWDSFCPETPRNEICSSVKEAVAYLVGARLHLNNCDCECGTGMWFRGLSEDLAIVMGAGRYVTQSMLDNPFGNRRGERMAWDRLRALTGNRLAVRNGSY